MVICIVSPQDFVQGFEAYFKYTGGKMQRYVLRSVYLGFY